jgi:hypothetical protein
MVLTPSLRIELMTSANILFSTTLFKNTRKTVAAASAPPKEQRCSRIIWRRASARFALWLLLFPLFASAQAGPPQTVPAQPPPPFAQAIEKMLNAGTGAWTAEQIKTMERVRDSALNDNYALSELRHVTNNIGPRLAGSPQAQAAVEYVASEMRQLGAEVQLEKVTVPHWVRGIETAELVKWPGCTSGTTQKVVVTALGGSPSTGPEGIRAQIVIANKLSDVKAIQAAGLGKDKILLLNYEFDKDLAAQGLGGEAYEQAVVYRAAAPALAAMVGAKAVLVRSVGGADYRLPHTGYTHYTPESAQIPAGAVTAEDATIMESLSHEGPLELHLTLTPQNMPPAESANVIADWKGSTNPEQIVVVSGHLDSWDLGTGAIDDGAGVAVAMQAIHILKTLGLHPKRTIRFVAWMDEESTTAGAQTYATEHAAERAMHVGMLESDTGAGHPTGVWFAGKPELENWLAPVARVLQPIGAGALQKVSDAGTDIGFMCERGVPGFSPAQDTRFYFNYHHTPADTFDKVNPRELSENAAVMAVMAYALADASELAPR